MCRWQTVWSHSCSDTCSNSNLLAILLPQDCVWQIALEKFSRTKSINDRHHVSGVMQWHHETWLGALSNFPRDSTSKIRWCEKFHSQPNHWAQLDSAQIPLESWFGQRSQLEWNTVFTGQPGKAKTSDWLSAKNRSCFFLVWTQWLHAYPSFRRKRNNMSKMVTLKEFSILFKGGTRHRLIHRALLILLALPIIGLTPRNKASVVLLINSIGVTKLWGQS